jgi:hypothetical protein
MQKRKQNAFLFFENLKHEDQDAIKKNIYMDYAKYKKKE